MKSICRIKRAFQKAKQNQGIVETAEDLYRVGMETAILNKGEYGGMLEVNFFLSFFLFLFIHIYA